MIQLRSIQAVETARHLRARLVTTLAAGIIALGVPEGNASAPVEENQVKAAFLFNIVRFVEWPPEATAGPLVMAVAADEAFSAALEQVAGGRLAHGRTVEIRRLARGEDDPGSCHLLFVSSLDDRRSGELLRRTRAGAVLTVGETTAFLRAGGAVRIYSENNRLRFQINTGSTEQARLRVSSQLLSLATR